MHRWTGFKIIGDNLDKNVHPNFMRLSSQTKSLHFFHAYAALDRIDFSGLSESTPIGVINVEKACLTSEDELLQIMADFYTLSVQGTGATPLRLTLPPPCNTFPHPCLPTSISLDNHKPIANNTLDL